MNLIICLTPLQMLIAEKIIQNKNLKNNILICLSYNDSDKSKYYYNRLSLLCKESYFFMINHSSLLKKIFSMSRLRLFLKKIKKNSFSGCYLASIDCPYIQLITSNIKYKNLYTFDDGTINLLETSPYYQDKKYSFFENVFRLLFSINDKVSKYIKKSLIHYTIFKDNRNIIDRTEFISLFDIQSLNQSTSKKITKFFLGQPLFEIKLKKETLMKFLNQEKIDYYYPHPREIEKIEGINYVINNKIFEDYLIDYLDKNSGETLEIYTFFSTAILNVKDMSRVRVISCYHRNIDNRFKSIYELFQKMDIPIKDIQD